MSAEEKEVARLAELAGLTDEKVAARIIDSLQTSHGLTGLLGQVSKWVRDIRDAERRKAAKGARLANQFKEGGEP